MKDRILFIVNPISGGQDKITMPSLIDNYLDHSVFDAKIVFTEYSGHATILAADAIKNNFDCVVSVGGDGTINEIASVLESSGKVMGIIPCGSGNGLARSLGIPLNKAEAIKNLSNKKIQEIDCGTLNDKKFFNVAGLGFDAHISALFANNKNRGFMGYITETLKAIKNYQPQNYTIKVDDKVIKRKAFMVSVANSPQYGNNAYISPQAKLDDGLLDVCIIKPFSLKFFPSLVVTMFNKTAHLSKFVEIVRGKNIIISREKDDAIHIDGEPLLVSREIMITAKQKTLKLFV